MASEDPIVVCSIDKSRQSEEAFECKYPNYAAVFYNGLNNNDQWRIYIVIVWTHSPTSSRPKFLLFHVVSGKILDE